MESAVQQINSVGCVTIEVASASALDYVSVQLGSDYSSHVGRQGGPQNLTVVAKTIDRGTVMHELLHSLGIYSTCFVFFRNQLVRKGMWYASLDFYHPRKQAKSTYNE